MLLADYACSNWRDAMIKFKNSVRCQKTLIILAAAANAAAEVGIADVYITSGNDSMHMPDSRHYTDEALDFRTKDKTPEQVERWVENLKKRLGRDYDVVLEADHLHVEHDPK